MNFSFCALSIVNAYKAVSPHGAQWLCGRVPVLQSGGCGFASQPGLLFVPRSTQPFIPPGSVNEYQLRLGRQRQVWLIPIADERVGVQVKL